MLHLYPSCNPGREDVVRFFVCLCVCGERPCSSREVLKKKIFLQVHSSVVRDSSWHFHLYWKEVTRVAGSHQSGTCRGREFPDGSLSFDQSHSRTTYIIQNIVFGIVMRHNDDTEHIVWLAESTNLSLIIIQLFIFIYKFPFFPFIEIKLKYKKIL